MQLYSCSEQIKKAVGAKFNYPGRIYFPLLPESTYSYSILITTSTCTACMYSCTDAAVRLYCLTTQFSADVRLYSSAVVRPYGLASDEHQNKYKYGRNNSSTPGALNVNLLPGASTVLAQMYHACCTAVRAWHMRTYAWASIVLLIIIRYVNILTSYLCSCTCHFTRTHL